jgi:superfamily II DNA/RNA helicase
LTSFAELGLEPRILDALVRTKIETPVPVQAEAIPPLLDGDDVVIEAPTGSGKTHAFLLPAAQGLLTSTGQGPRVLVVTPTRELAIQIDAVWKGLATGLRSALLYGGVGYATQTNDLKKGPDIIIGTPGRILDMVGKRLVTLSRVEYLVLDEADEMLDAGFAPDVEKIMAMTYQPQTVLASATMPSWVTRLVEKHTKDALKVRVVNDSTDNLEHGMLRTAGANKLQLLSNLLHRHKGSAIVFGRTRHGVKKLNRHLRQMGHDSVELQGDLSQPVRDRTMAAFRDGRSRILVATNVAARGIDVDHVGLVVNYELPDSPQWLTHRVGRTARMGEAGRALTLVAPEDEFAWGKLSRQGAVEIREVDAKVLLDEGAWRYVEGRPAQSALAGATTVRRSASRRRQRTWAPSRPRGVAR